MGRKAKWDQRYSSKTVGISSPEGFLTDHISHFKSGSILDIACGNGRNAIFLAKNGFDVTGIDFSTVALEQLTSFSNKNNLNIKTVESDLSLNNAFEDIKSFDNIIITRYKLDKTLLHHIPSMLTNNGVFLYCTFNNRQDDHEEFKKKFYLHQGELTKMTWDLELVKYISFKDDNGYLDGYLFKK